MMKITPYNDIQHAMLALDNGGRFYNLLSKANNRVITRAELTKVAGFFNDKQQLIIFLELSLCNLSAGMKSILLEKFTPDLRKLYHMYKPNELLSSEAIHKGLIGINAILTGIPRLVESRNELNGFVMVPLMAGKSINFTMVPIIEKYEIYEIRDDENSEPFLIAHAKGEEKLPEKPVKIGGLLKELKADKNELIAHRKFLDVYYYIEMF